MAEFPELGKNCSLEACKKLEKVLPLCMHTCETSIHTQNTASNSVLFDEHRFDHSCQFKKVNTEQLLISNCDGCKPLKPYLCSMDGCFTSETIQIDCQHCGYNFCLKHRYAEEHQCHVQGVTNKRINSDLQEGLEKKVSMIIANRRNFAEASIPSSSEKKKPMDEEAQRRADRIAIMRLKLITRNCDIPAAEQMFLFVTENQKREPIMVSKRWSIGRCVDQIARHFSILNNNATFGAKVLRLYCKADQANPLPMSDNIEKYLKDLSNVFLKRDE
uniref:AN1-type domain-containing protein n=1 Tax=Elaeophora elaphi TaxID=1147741 RepID=A0A0R3RFA8_9BILA